MQFGAIEILLIGLGTLVLTLIALWLREKLIDWQVTRHHREEAGAPKLGPGISRGGKPDGSRAGFPR